jgi:enoyl-CoA hydratase
MTDLKLTLHDDGVAVVSMAKPPMNVMDASLLEGLAALFDRLAADNAVRAAVLVGEGKAFSAGLDLKVVPTLDLPGQHRLIAAMNDGFGTLYAWPKPLVTAINGHAIAGGMVVALCGDWRIVADVPLQASLAEVRVGVPYPVAALDVAKSELAPTAARRLILFGEALDAAGMMALSVFDECVPASTLLARAIGRARKDAALPAHAFATTKRELRAVALARIAAARAGQAEPRYSAWLSEETQRAADAALRGAV